MSIVNLTPAARAFRKEPACRKAPTETTGMPASHARSASPEMPPQVGLAHRAYAAPHMNRLKFGHSQPPGTKAPPAETPGVDPPITTQHSRPIDYSDDHLRDIWLSNDPRHEKRWLNANQDADRILKAAHAKGLDPQETAFMISSPAKLLQVAARGLPNMPHDWIHGMQLYDLAQNENAGLGHILELVLNTKPSIAYLLNTNTPVETRLVIAHVYGHTDFFKRNRFFKDTRPDQILEIIGRQRKELKSYVTDLSIPRDPNSSRNPVKEFINKLHSIEDLIDRDAEEHPLSDLECTQYIQPVHPQEQSKKAPPTQLDQKDRYLYSAEDWLKMQEQLQKDAAPRKKKFPAGIERDLLGFLAKHSPTLSPWQRRILQMKREQQYYFLPQRQTKIMNEGWASFWHTKLVMEDPATTEDQISELSLLNGSVITAGQNGLNPYWLGFNIWQDLYIKAGLGVPLNQDTPPQYRKYDMHTISRVPQFNEKKALAKLYEVCANERDYSFVEKYMTPSLAEKMELFKIEEEEGESRFSNHRKNAAAKAQAFEEVHNVLLGYLNYCGQPVLEVVDGDFENNGELLINHTYTTDSLNVEDTRQTVDIIASLWGRPVHLDTYMRKNPKNPASSLVAVRYTADPKKYEVQTFLREDRKATKAIQIESNGTLKI
jgi:stage V sporulation protein R